MDLFKRTRGRPPKAVIREEVIKSENDTVQKIELEEVSEMDIDTNFTTTNELVNTNDISTLQEEFDVLQTDYQTLQKKYIEVKDQFEKLKKETKSIEEISQLTESIKTLFNKFKEIGTGNNRWRTPFDSVKIFGSNGVLDEFIKHFPSIKF